MKILVTGGNGFIGHHFCEHLLKNTNWDIYIVDKMTYASAGFDRLKDIECYRHERVHHFAHDFTLPIIECFLEILQEVDYIIHMGAETHVDNSINEPEPFIRTNVLGTMNMLQFARRCTKLRKFIYFSTDEVFGPCPKETRPGGYEEWDRYDSTNPYSASKAGGEELCLAWANTYKVPIIITHTMNVFGERQHPEKFVPMTIRKLLKGEVIKIHADPTKTISGSRFWIHARNVAEAITHIMDFPVTRDKFNIVGEKEVSNLEMAEFIAKILQVKCHYEMVDFHSSRPGHDLRYGLNGTKLKNTGFEFPKTFEDSLEKTIQWTLDNPKWLAL